MQSSIFTFMFLASAPLALMPAIVALITRHRNRYLLGALNLGVWAIAYLSVREFIVPGAPRFPVSVPVFAVAWLALSVWAFRGADRVEARAGS